MFRAALRPLVRRPGPSVVIVLTLAVTIAAATVTYSIVDMFWHALPVRDTGRMAFIASTDPRPSQSQAGVYNGVAWTGVSIPDLADFTARTHSFEQFAGYTFGTATLTGTTEPERLQVLRMTTNLLPAWGLAPRAGRGLVGADGQPGAPRVVLLSDRFWKQRFDRSPAILGRPVIINGEPHAVVGVLPSVMDAGLFGGTDIALPVTMDPIRAARDERRLFVTAILRRGVTRDQARADLESVVRQLQREHPRTNAHTGIVVRPLIENLGGTIPMLIVFLELVAGALIVVACANVANILLALAGARARELAVRRALGATRRAHVAQLTAEGALLALAACPIGMLLAWAGLQGLKVLDAGANTPLGAIGLNPRVVLACVLMSAGATLGFALLPALRTSRWAAGLQIQTPTSSAPPRRFFTHALVALQVGIAVVLLVQVTSFVRAAWTFVATPHGFDERGLLTFRLDLDSPRYADANAVNRLASNLLERVSSIPGVTAAAAINRMPIADRELGTRMALEGTHPRPEDELPATLATITDRYLPAMGIPAVRGRGLTADDVTERRPVALVSVTAARRYWPGRDPIGARVTIDALGSEPVEIVGIAGDVRNSDVDQGPAPQVYVPFTLQPPRAVAVVVRTAEDDPTVIAPAVRREVAQVDRALPVFDVRPMTRVLFEDMAGSILVASVLGTIGLVALLLAVAGVYGLVSHVVNQRTREIGIRMAVGAQPRAVMQMVLTQGARPVAVGALLGAAAAFAMALLATAAMNEVNFRDPLTYVVVVFGLVAVAVLSSYVPARRAARVDPVMALRSE